MADDDGRGFQIASAYVSVSLDEDELDADIADLNSKLAGIRNKSIYMGLNAAQVDADIAAIKAQLESIRDQNAGVGLNQGDLDAAIASIQAKLAALGAEKVDIRIGASGGPETTAELGGLAAVMKAIDDNAGPLVAALMGVSSSEKSTGDQAQNAVGKLAAAGAAAAEAGQMAYSASGWWGMLSKEVTLFGGALGDTHMIGQIPLWHILMDGILETTIGLIEATVALTAFGMAAAPAAEDIYNHIKSVDDVVHALGIDIPPVTGHMHALGQALAPQILELYGGALNSLSSNGSILAGIITKITTGFDDWMAKYDLFQAKQSHTDGLIAAGGEVLKQVADVIDNLGVAFENLMKADPGTVHFLLDVVEGASKVIEIFTEIPTPILYGALAIHSFLLWGGLLTTWATNILSPLESLGKVLFTAGANVGLFGEWAQKAIIPVEDLRTAESMAAAESATLGERLAALAASPWTWAVAGAALIADIVYETGRASAGVTSFIASMDNALSQLNAGQAILQINADIGQLNDQISKVSTTQIAKSWSDLGNTMNSFGKDTDAVGADFARSFDQITGGHIISGLSALGHGLEGIFVPGQGAAVQAADNIDAYRGEIIKLTGDQTNLFHEVGNLMQVQVKYTDQTVRAAAGIHAVGGAFTQTTTSAYTYTQALALMGLAGVQSTDSYALMQQKVENLIRGYEDMSVQGGLLANSVDAVTFSTEQQSSKVTALTQGWSAFISMVTGGQSAFDTFQTQVAGLATAAGSVSNIGVSAGKASLSIKATGATAAKTSAQIDDLSASGLQLNETFGQAITDGNSMMNTLLEQASAAGLGAKGTAMLTQAGKDMVAQLLPMADGSSEATAQLYALAQEAGYHGAGSFQSLVGWVGKTKDAEQNLQSITSRLTVASANLAGDVENLANAMNQNLNQAMSAAILQASGGQTAFDQFATAALHAHGNLGDLKTSATQLATELLDTIGNTTQAHNEFDTFAQMLGLTKQQADKLWASVERLAQAESRIPDHVSTTITITEDLIGAMGVGAAHAGPSVHAAAGWRVPGYGGGDRWPALLEGGEAVVPKQLVPPIAPYLKAHGVPGFERGGMIPSGAHVAPAGTVPAAPVINNNTFNLEFSGARPTQEEWHAIQMKLSTAFGL